MRIERKTIIYFVITILFLIIFKMPNYCSNIEADRYIFENAAIECRIENTDIDQAEECSDGNTITSFIANWEYFTKDKSKVCNISNRETQMGCDFVNGDDIYRVPYAYGLNDTPEEFKKNLALNKGAGCHFCHYDMWHSATKKYFTGCDCAGFVCNIWHIPRTSVANWKTIAYQVPRWDAKQGDSLLIKGYVILYDGGDLQLHERAYIYEAWPGRPEPGVRYLLKDVSGFKVFRKGEDISKPQITEVRIDPKIITPNDDGFYNKGKLTFNVSDEHCGALKILKCDIIIDDYRNTINLPIKDYTYSRCKEGIKLPRKSEIYKEDFVCHWDGKDSSGNTLPNGKYKIKITAEDLNGNRTIVKKYYFRINR